MSATKGLTLITGGAGFIGSNLAHRLCSTGRPVLLYDDLSRAGVERNLEWLRRAHGELVRVEVADVRDADRLRRAVASAERVFHFAAQVAVTTSLEDPVRDFEINARGTLNVLEAIRVAPHRPPLVFTSTNKVYGELVDLKLRREPARYLPEDRGLARSGVGETRSLDFHSPYGCSKGAADQYVIDYARIYRIPAVVFRMSCIYGPHQFGTEDQGWVAHFLIRVLEGKPITIHGDGAQVRDILFVEDLVDALLVASSRAGDLGGRAFNIGGGPENTVSLLELLDLIGATTGLVPHIRFTDWRAGDQRWYVSDTSRFRAAAGWRQRVGVRPGVAALHRWLADARTAAPPAERALASTR
jgi:CDP-paratose 2-epimerase